MRSALAYSPRPGALTSASAVAVSLYLGSFALVAFAFSNPIVLAGAGAAVIAAGLAAGAGRALAAAGRWGMALGVFVVLVNGLVSQRGETILLRGGEVPILGRIDVSAEALAEGGVLALRILVVFLAFAVHSASVDPDRVLRLVRPFARHSALTATLIARLVPLAAADLARIRAASALRGPAASPVSRPALVRRLVAGSLDRAVDVAATLELRGYAHGAPRRGDARPACRASRWFALGGVAAIVVALGARLADAGGFEAYPSIGLDAGPGTLALAAGLPVLALAPYAAARLVRGLGGRR
jgi:energy-coupling factor transport system permease protein